MKLYFSRHFFMRLLMVVAAFAVGALLYDKLPDPFPTHWNLAGQADGWSNKNHGLWFIPSMALVMMIALPLLAKIDPRRKNYLKFKPAWELIQTVIVAFLIFIYNLQIYVALNPGSDSVMVKGMMLSIGVLLILMGLAMPQIESNYFVGIRTPWTLDDKAVWKKTHELGGKMFMLAGAVFISGIFCSERLIWLILAAATLSALVPVGYSYFISKKA